MRKRDRIRIAALCGGVVFALLAAFGFQAEHYGESYPGPALLAAVLLFVPISFLFDCLFRRLKRSTPLEDDRPISFWGAFLLLVLCRLPAFILLFPGSFAYDVPYQLQQIATGVYSTHHPLVHTLFLGACVQLGRLIGHINLGAALYSLLQVLLLSMLNVLTCESILRQGGSRAARLSLWFFALYPVHMLMAINATKDVLFGGWFALALALFREHLSGDDQEKRHGALLFIATLCSVLLRNNMAYALLAFLICLLLARQACPALILSCALISGILLGQGLATMLHAKQGDTREMLSWPIQQIARISVQEREKLTDEEKEMIDDLLPHMAWQKYDPTVSDPVKFEFVTEKLRENPGKYARLCLSLLNKCPRCSLDAVLMLTHAYLYPYGQYRVSGRYLQTGVTKEDYTGWEEIIADASPLPGFRDALDWRFGAKGAMQIPVIGWFFNLGLIAWLMLYFILRGFAIGDPGEALSGLWPLFLFGTFLLGPVMAGRYAYAFISVLPVLWTRMRSIPSKRTV